MYYCQSRYYVPEWCRWLTPDDVSNLNPTNINGINLYSYVYKHPLNIYGYEKIRTTALINQSTKQMYINSGLFFGTLGAGSGRISSDLLDFSVGLLTPKNYNMPSWMSVYAIYAKGSFGWSYNDDNNFSFFSFSTGVLDATFNLGDTPFYVGVGIWNFDAEVGDLFSVRADIISSTVGYQVNDSFSIEATGYLGIGASLDFSNGIKLGIGVGFGFEISFIFEWWWN